MSRAASAPEQTNPPKIVFATPRKLPKPAELGQRVVVMDIAFASNAGGSSFEKTTQKFIQALGSRLVAWIDHHDSDYHALYADDSRFVLHTKAEHGACPQIITPDIVAAAGPVDTVVTHIDFDGLASAAKWIRGGVECYPGCDLDAFAIDTRSALPSSFAQAIDRALKVDQSPEWLTKLVLFLANDADQALLASHDANSSTHRMLAEIAERGASARLLERHSEQLAERYVHLDAHTVLVDVSEVDTAFDRTWLLLLGQQRARVAVVVNGESATFAAHYRSGIDFLKLFDISGGMPTVLSIQSSQLDRALGKLAEYFADSA